MPAIHFAVGSETGLRSSIWEIEADKNDIYIAPEGLRQKIKTSLHASGKWRFGVSKEFCDDLKSAGVWPGGDRKLEGWPRPSEFSLVYTLAFRIVFPASELRVWPTRESDMKCRSVTWLPMPLKEHAVEVDILYTRQFVEIHSSTGKKLAQVEMNHDWPGQTTMGTQLLTQVPLPSGEMLWIVYRIIDTNEGLLTRIENSCRTMLNKPPELLYPEQSINLSKSSMRVYLFGDEGDGSYYIIEIAGDTLLKYRKIIADKD